MSKRKSRRPWMSSVGVVIDESCAIERARRRERRHRRHVRARDERARRAEQLGIPAALRHERREQLDEPRLREALRRERRREVRPRDHRDDRLERDARDGRVPDGAAAERDAERADLRVGDLGARREPGEQLLRVLHVARPVEPEEAARDAVPARVARERRVAGRREEGRRDRLHVLVLAAETVEEHHRRPAAGRRRPVRLGERAGELRAVGRRDRQLLRRRRERGSAPGERGGDDGEK